MSDVYSSEVSQASARALELGIRRSDATTISKHTDNTHMPRMMSALMRHGGLYTLLDSAIMRGRIAGLMTPDDPSGTSSEMIDNFVRSLGSGVAGFFSHLVTPTKYVLDSSLISYLTYPVGVPSVPPGGPTTPMQGKIIETLVGKPSPLPAAFTFIGQFIDHDLTMNGVDLFDNQLGSVPDTASPFIDLDSVYGPRTLLAQLPTLPTGQSPLPDSIYNDDGTFLLHKKTCDKTGKCFYDLCRDREHKAYISDARNDENQMVLQIHMLIMRVHNKLMRTVFTGSPETLHARLLQTYEETLFAWQSVIIHDYLPKILYTNGTPSGNTLEVLLGELQKPSFGNFVYKPLLDLSTGLYTASLPHEFAIGFRFGHSQLKSMYQLNSLSEPVTLFNNRLVAGADGSFDDLRGSQPLRCERVMEFNHFAGYTAPAVPHESGNLIDGFVTPVVFDLPESTIPDDIKFISNLAQRNLIRSSQVGLCSGEDLADLYTRKVGRTLPPGVTFLLTPAEVDPATGSHGLYMRPVYDANGRPVCDPTTHKQKTEFATPLWYYVLREAELKARTDAGMATGSLGPLGSRLVGEVILGAIAWNKHSVLTELKNNPEWTSKVNNSATVTLLDLARFVEGDCEADNSAPRCPTLEPATPCC